MQRHVLNLLTIFISFSLVLSAKSPETDNGKIHQEAKKQKEDTKQENKVEEREKAPNPEKLLKIGNLAFPVSQQPAPLISFGQNILKKNKPKHFC